MLTTILGILIVGSVFSIVASIFCSPTGLKEFAINFFICWCYLIIAAALSVAFIFGLILISH